ncbi:hypothetical protein D9M68_922030 [compost metagenome]
MIGCGDDQTIRLILLNHLKEAVEYTPDFTNIVGQTTLGTNGIELVKKVDATSVSDCIENLAQLGSSLAHELSDQAIEPDYVERDSQLTGES